MSASWSTEICNELGESILTSFSGASTPLRSTSYHKGYIPISDLRFYAVKVLVVNGLLENS